MKLEKLEKNSMYEELENFKKERKQVKENLDDVKLDNKLTIEVPLLTANAIKEIRDREEQLKTIMKPAEKAAEDFVKQEEDNRKEAEKKAKNLSEEYLNENFKDRWSINEGVCTVKCKGRRELRQIIEQCKAQGIRYKFAKKLDEDYKYDFTYSIGNGLKPTNESVEDEKVLKINPNAPKVEIEKEDTSKVGEEGNPVDNLKNAGVSKLEGLNENVSIKEIGDNSFAIGGNDNFEVKIGRGEEGKEIFASRWSGNYYSKDQIKDDIENLKTLLAKVEEFEKVEGVKPLGYSHSKNESLNNNKVQEPLTEDLHLIGDLKDFNPSDEAAPLWNEINEKGLFLNFKQLLDDLYPKGIEIDTLNKLLAVSDDFVREMLKMDNIENLKSEEPIEIEKDVKIEKEPQVDLSDDALDDIDDDASDLEDVVAQATEEGGEEEPSDNPKENRERFLNNATGYGEDDDDEDNVSAISSLAR